MAFGSTNMPGAEAVARRQAETALEARVTAVEAAQTGSADAIGKPGGVATLDDMGKVPESQLPSLLPFVAGTSAPADKKKLWIDTTATTGGLKYWNGSAWAHVPVTPV